MTLKLVLFTFGLLAIGLAILLPYPQTIVKAPYSECRIYGKGNELYAHFPNCYSPEQAIMSYRAWTQDYTRHNFTITVGPSATEGVAYRYPKGFPGSVDQ